MKSRHDCAVLGVSNMFHILTGADIGRTKIQEDKMIDRLLQRIKSGHFQEFEKSDGSNIVFCKIKKIKFQIFCHCRFPRESYHYNDKNQDEACSDSCKEWYHSKYENI